MQRKNRPRTYCKKHSYASSNGRFLAHLMSFSRIPYLCITKHHFRGNRYVTSKHTNLTRVIGTVTRASNVLLIHVQVDVTPTRHDSNQVGLIEASLEE